MVASLTFIFVHIGTIPEMQRKIPEDGLATEIKMYYFKEQHKNEQRKLSAALQQRVNHQGLNINLLIISFVFY